MTRKELEKGIKFAIKQAYIAYEKDEIPVGCCLIIPKEDMTTNPTNKQYDYICSHNTVEKKDNPFLHAEILTLLKAINKYNIKYFLNSTLVVTLEPCPICYYAIRKLGIKEIYYLLENKDDGAISKEYGNDKKINTHYIFNEKYANLFEKFFDEFKQTKKISKKTKTRLKHKKESKNQPNFY